MSLVIANLKSNNAYLPIIKLDDLTEKYREIVVLEPSLPEVEINLVSKLIDIGNIAILELYGTKRYLISVLDSTWHLLGWNATFPFGEAFKPVFLDKYFVIPYITSLFRKILKLSPIEEKVLSEALIELVDEGNVELDNLISKIEELSSILPSGDRIRLNHLITYLQLLQVGRCGSTLRLKEPVLKIKGNTYIDFSLLPHMLKYLIYGLVGIWLLINEKLKNMIMVLCGPFNNISVGVLQLFLELALVFNRRIVIIALNKNLLNKLLNYLTNYVILYYENEHWVVNDESGVKYELDIEKLPFKVPTFELPACLIKPLGKERITLLEKVFGNMQIMAYKALAFLREGATTRDGLVSYLTYAFNIRTSDALRLITKLMAYGLIEEIIGKDTKYWLRLTIRGYGALEEYEKVKGGEMNGQFED